MDEKKKKIRGMIILAGIILAVVAAILNLKIEPADYTKTLEKQIETAQELVKNAEIGNEKGQYLQQTVDQLKEEIVSAKMKLKDKAGYEEMKTTCEELKKKCKLFKNSKNKKDIQITQAAEQEQETTHEAAETVSGEAQEMKPAATEGIQASAQEVTETQMPLSNQDVNQQNEKQTAQTTEPTETGSQREEKEPLGSLADQTSEEVQQTIQPENSQQSTPPQNPAATEQTVNPSTNVPSASTSKPIENDKINVTIEIRCDTVSNNMSVLQNNAIKKYIPKDGVILAKTKVAVDQGKTVSDVLHYATRNADIQLETSTSGQYSSEYVEGIQYLYEFNCGALSGWMYKVNDVFPNYGCSSYKVQEGDRIVFVYTCDLGRDVGNEQ